MNHTHFSLVTPIAEHTPRCTVAEKGHPILPFYAHFHPSILLFCYPSMLPYFHLSISATCCLLRMRTIGFYNWTLCMNYRCPPPPPALSWVFVAMFSLSGIFSKDTIASSYFVYRISLSVRAILRGMQLSRRI